MTIEPAEYTTGPTDQPEWRSADVDGDRLLITTATIPMPDGPAAPGLYFRTDHSGSSITVDQLAALLARLPVIADAARTVTEEHNQ